MTSASTNVVAGPEQARAHGERLLREVREENLAELLHTLHHLHSPPPTSPHYTPLGIKPLDDILRSFHPKPYTSGATYTPRQPVLEITSPASADGKTHLLYYITALAVLPCTYQNIALRGRSSAVVFLDTDCRFDAARLREVARGIVLESAVEQGISFPGAGHNYGGGGKEGDDEGMNTMLHTALSHVHVFRPQSSASLLATIQSIESYLLRGMGTIYTEGEHKHASHSRPLHAILLDSASAFYWQDRREMEVLNIHGVREERARRARDQNENQNHNDTDTNSTTHTPTAQSQLPHQIIHALRALQQTFSCPLVFTTWGLLRATQSTHHSNNTSHALHAQTTTRTPLYKSHRPSFRPHLPRPWPSFPTCRVVVQREVVRPFAPFLTMEEIKGEARERQDAVRRGGVVGWVDGHGLTWDRERNAMAERLFGFSHTGGGGVRWIDEDGDGEG
ncbi:Rad51 family DNA repair protein [Blastomyces gilchristii SLH14081]|uniref:Rad51 family DNA repair protein n=1 Tax=Blastomyces gilchristii (strain SLH14081) TaxID=559298 RepID=A0A179UQP1_BLAGS|nr:Rad51 family DNA repair protein [Blastomyces gilchristii SLH14081]OAT09397.1 Rad51 family DNA repair protein [Blastomyces gilchristii SLH14081]